MKHRKKKALPISLIKVKKKIVAQLIAETRTKTDTTRA
jgi:hypothetical protein